MNRIKVMDSWTIKKKLLVMTIALVAVTGILITTIAVNTANSSIEQLTNHTLHMKLDGDVNAVMVGDSKPDVEFGLAAGMKTIAVTFGYNDIDKLKDAGAKNLADKFIDLIDLM